MPSLLKDVFQISNWWNIPRPRNSILFLAIQNLRKIMAKMPVRIDSPYFFVNPHGKLEENR